MKIFAKMCGINLAELETPPCRKAKRENPHVARALMASLDDICGHRLHLYGFGSPRLNLQSFGLGVLIASR